MQLCSFHNHSLQIFSDTRGDGYWKLCFAVPGVTLPTGYFFGMTAATGDLSGEEVFYFFFASEENAVRLPISVKKPSLICSFHFTKI